MLGDLRAQLQIFLGVSTRLMCCCRSRLARSYLDLVRSCKTVTIIVLYLAITRKTLQLDTFHVISDLMYKELNYLSNLVFVVYLWCVLIVGG